MNQKMQLWNTFDRATLEKQLLAVGHQYITISFYQYAHILDPVAFRNQLYLDWSALAIVGRTYIAKEGINAQIAVPKVNLGSFREVLYKIDFLNGIRLNFAIDDAEADFAFLKLKIKVKSKILADGLHDATFDVTQKGIHLDAYAFNQLTNDPNTLLIDFRNHYEWEVGHFKGAILPDVDTFRASLPFIEQTVLKGNEDKNIVMYCTGGVRCEKASAWFKHRGFKNVHQLEGGIIKYANDCKEQNLENKFIGKNFVFDERRGERITADTIAVCHQCGSPADTHTNCINDACHLLFIQCEACKVKMENCCSEACLQTIHLPLEVQKELRKGQNKSNLIFKKGRSSALPFQGQQHKPQALIDQVLKNQNI